MCSTPGFLLYTSTDAFPPKVFWGGGEANAARKAIWSRVRGRGAYASRWGCEHRAFEHVLVLVHMYVRI